MHFFGVIFMKCHQFLAVKYCYMVSALNSFQHANVGRNVSNWTLLNGIKVDNFSQVQSLFYHINSSSCKFENLEQQIKKNE